MERLQVLLKDLFDQKLESGPTASINISMASPTHCKVVERFFSSGTNMSRVVFNPPVPVEEALLKAKDHTKTGILREQKDKK
jgi:hypothetical protein